MGAEDNKAVSRRFITEVFNDGKYEVADELLAENFSAHSSGNDQGRDEFKEMVRAFRGAFPDYHCTIDDQIAEGDQVATRWTFHGTQTGPLMGLPPTGRPVEVTGVAIDRVVDGQLVESWLELDMNRMLQQLGAAPPPPTA